MTSSIGGIREIDFDFNKSKSLVQLTVDDLKRNPNALSEIIHCLTQQKVVDWDKIDQKVLGLTIDLFLSKGSDEQLKYFIEHHISALNSEDEGLLYPNLTILFFKKVADVYEARLTDLDLPKPLLTAMFFTKICRNIKLINALYKKNPQHEFFNQVKSNVSENPFLIYLRPHLWYLDMVNLLEKPLEEKELKIQLNELLNGFKIEGNINNLIALFALKFFSNDTMLSEEKINRVIQAITSTPLFTKNKYEWNFIEQALKLRTRIWIEYKKNYDSLMVPLIKGFVSEKAPKSTILKIIENLSSKEQQKAVLEGLKECPEPSKTFHIRYLYKFNKQVLELPLEEIDTIFKEVQLEYKNFLPISRIEYKHAFFQFEKGLLGVGVSMVNH